MRRTRDGTMLEDGPILITGAAGFVGQHLMRELAMDERDVACDAHTRFEAPAGVRKLRWELPGEAPKDAGEVRYVVHLAAISSVSRSLEDVHQAYRTNLMGTISLLEYLIGRSPRARLLLVSSSEVYSPSNEIMAEQAPIGPVNPYGASKAAAEIAARQFSTSYGLDIVVARSFPHFGPGQSPGFALPSFCRRIVRAARSGKKVIRTGNLQPVRDYLYIADVVRAYACLLAGGLRGCVCNVCSGEGRSMAEMLEILIRLSGSSLQTEIDPELYRPVDVERQIGDPSMLEGMTGWRKQVSIENGLAELLEWWEDRT